MCLLLAMGSFLFRIELLELMAQAIKPVVEEKVSKLLSWLQKCLNHWTCGLLTAGGVTRDDSVQARQVMKTTQATPIPTSLSLLHSALSSNLMA